MRILLATEKCGPIETQRDGGARLVETLQQSFGEALKIMQFGTHSSSSATWHFNYPLNPPNRFERRLVNALFIAEKIKGVEHNFTHILFIHISMQFGLVDLPLKEEICIWTFPMFLTPSYKASGETVPKSYFEREYLTLKHSKHILTPSYLEKQQLMEVYSVPSSHIHVIPRGINTRFLEAKIRSFHDSPRFCSIGSIKPQKNTLGLIRLFSKLKERFQGASLKIVGPIQDTTYYAEIQTEIRLLKLYDAVELTGYIAPPEFPQVLKDMHLHLSTSTCETFGRAIFETLASGLPNVARAGNNAAVDILKNLPYVRFVDNSTEAIKAVEEMLKNLEKLSLMAQEIGNLYDDVLLSQLLVAKICNLDPIVIADFDGTLYHKDDPEKTERCLNAFSQFTQKIICSARPIDDLLEQIRIHNLEVDWIIGYSGAVVTDVSGKPLWLTSLELKNIEHLEALFPQSKRIEVKGKILQLAIPVRVVPHLPGIRIEVYQDTTFIAHWEASKLRAVHRLLRYINWCGQVKVFGDGLYDTEMLTYFDGTYITPFPTADNNQRKEIEYA